MIGFVSMLGSYSKEIELSLEVIEALATEVHRWIWE